MKPIFLADLLRSAGIEPIGPVAQGILVSGVTESTEGLDAGMLFVARKGETHDGHCFLSAAAAKGAAAAIVEKRVGSLNGLPCIRVENSREALGRLCAAYHGNPSRNLRLIGVTGTDGKTTTTHLVASVLRAAGHKVSLIGSVGSEIDGRIFPTDNTTPPPPLLQSLLANAAETGQDYVVMEVSSHAIVQGRLAGCRFLGGILTNVAADHLDLHPTLRSYRAAKRRFFQEYLADGKGGAEAWQVLNLGEPTGKILRSLDGLKTILYGLGPNASVRAVNIASIKKRIEFRLVTPTGNSLISMRVTGRYNALNALAAAGAGLACEIPLEQIREGLESFPGVCGRFEYLETTLPFDVVIDYAHTPQGIQAVMREGKRLAARRLLVVFSAPGGRWTGKRDEMGRYVGQSADFAVVTSDNPGGENPQSIADDIIQGLMSLPPREGFSVELDRRRAIELILDAARPGDLVLLLGKGHEEFQLVAGEKIPFSEREVVSRFAERPAPAKTPRTPASPNKISKTA